MFVVMISCVGGVCQVSSMIDASVFQLCVALSRYTWKCIIAFIDASSIADWLIEEFLVVSLDSTFDSQMSIYVCVLFGRRSFELLP